MEVRLFVFEFKYGRCCSRICSITVISMTMSPRWGRDRAWAAETTRRGSSNPEHWEGKWKTLRKSERAELTPRKKACKMLYSSGFKGTRTRRIQGGATKHFIQGVTTSLVQRLEPIAWFDSMIWIAMMGGPPWAEEEETHRVGDPLKAKVGEKGRAATGLSTHEMKRKNFTHEFRGTLYGERWLTWINSQGKNVQCWKRYQYLFVQLNFN